MPRKIQILTDLLFIVSVLFRHFFPWHPTSGFPHHNRVETVPAHPSLLSCLKLQLEEQPFPAWVSWTPTAFASMGCQHSNPHDKIRSSCWRRIPHFPLGALHSLHCKYLWGEEKHILFFYVGKEMRAKRAVSVLLLLLLLWLREGWFGVFF